MSDVISPDMYVGMKLREKRLKSGFTIAQLAEKISVSSQLIQKYEQNKARIPAGTLFRIACELGAAPADFFDGFPVHENDSVSSEDVISPACADTPFHILLLADDPTEELSARTAMETSDIKHSVFCLHSDRQALDFLRGRSPAPFPRPDIIIAENHPARQYGFALLKEIKRDKSLSSLPVILFTGNPSLEEAEKAYRHGASGYIYKNLYPGSFTIALNETLNYWAKSCVLIKRNKRNGGAGSVMTA